MINWHLCDTFNQICVKYSFDVSEIVRVDWKIVDGGMGRNENITIRTASKRFSVGTLMNGFDDMSAYITANVDSSKIQIHNINLNNR